MIQEELYIISDTGRFKLDLQIPSGITLELVNNMFNDLSKITPSHSYTFKLPRTANNSRVLEFAEDVRHTSEYTKHSVKAEYRRDGIVIFNSCKLYVTAFEEGNYSAVLTMNVNEGLIRLSEKDIKLRDLKGTMYKSTADYDYEEDDVMVSPFCEGMPYEDITKFEEYCPFLQLQYPLYSCGCGKLKNEVAQFTSFKENDGTVKHLLMNFSFSTRMTETRKEEDGEYDMYIYDYAYPRPVMPLPYLIRKIEEHTGVKLNLEEENIYNLCVPLVNGKITDAAVRQGIGQLSIKGKHEDYLTIGNEFYYGNNKLSFLQQVTCGYPTNDKSDVIEKHVFFSVAHDEHDFWVEKIESMFFKYKLHEKCYWTKLILKGTISFWIKVESQVLTHYRERNTPLPKIDLYCLDSIEHRTTGKVGGFVIASLEGEVDEDQPLINENNDLQGYMKIVYKFNPEDGYEEIKTQRRAGPLFYFKLDDNGSDLNIDTIKNVEGNIDIYDCIDEYSSYAFNVFQNLPDISSMDLLKSVFYALGGFPNVDEKGNIKLITYKSIVEKVKRGEYYDWSKKVTDKANHIITKKDFSLGSTTGDSNMAKNNFYLMKNDELDDNGQPKPDKNLTDLFKHSFCNIEVGSDVLKSHSTIFQSVFYGAFERHKENPKLDSAGGTLHYSAKHANKMEIVDAKPVLGVVNKVKSKLVTIDYDKLDSIGITDMSNPNLPPFFEESDGEDILGMDIWQFPQDASYDENYGLLHNIYKDICEVEEYVELSAYELKTLDVTMPVYIEKYNSLFSIKKVEIKESIVCKVNLLKISNDVFDVEIKEKEIYTPNLTGRIPQGNKAYKFIEKTKDSNV